MGKFSLSSLLVVLVVGLFIGMAAGGRLNDLKRSRDESRLDRANTASDLYQNSREALKAQQQEASYWRASYMQLKFGQK